MTRAKVQFDANLAQARDLIGLATAIDASTTAALDTSDLLRAALVASVSALDHYVHELVREEMLATALGHRTPPTDAFKRFSISLDASLRAAHGASPADWMEDEVRRQHSHLSFQHPDKIADAERLVSDQTLWPALAGQFGMTAQDLKQRLLLIVTRRNQIAHEADRDPTPPHERWPISASDVEQAMALIEQVVVGIEVVV